MQDSNKPLEWGERVIVSSHGDMPRRYEGLFVAKDDLGYWVLVEGQRKATFWEHCWRA